MPAKWTGDIVGIMHNYKITQEDVALEMGVTKAYVSMILNGKKSPAGIKDRVEHAVNAIILRRREEA